MNLEIFIPYWGDADLLRQTVESVRAQDDPDWHLTVLNDRDPDDSVPAYFASLADPRITYVLNERNMGITENFREAVRRATGTHITIPGSDDLLQSNYVGLIKSVIARVPDVDVIQPGVDVIDHAGVAVLPLVDRVKQRLLAPRGGSGIALLRGEQMATSLIRGDWLYWPSLTFRSDTLKRIDFRDGLAVIQDLALLMDIAFDGGSLAYVPEKAFSYRRHESSASQRTLLDGRRFRDEREYFGLAADLAEKKGWRRTARVARLRLVARLHAVTVLPHVVRHGDSEGRRAALAHVFGR
ncbi:glycosyltransferase involved in cell wall biosynthesis [Microbacterium foliorum]|uniref:glycosyltransferase family 2 protein n=1 Tax=Microbacterium foliorum TaxID=104336 RepID=UPI00209CC263|nr:glycosyltransferase family 2 protein [Microbacterium foliorum]MCP1429491.1 glycosyltransferase involved in cell wall biosynthesis [Microbacterium foliorum]